MNRGRIFSEARIVDLVGSSVTNLGVFDTGSSGLLRVDADVTTAQLGKVTGTGPIGVSSNFTLNNTGDYSASPPRNWLLEGTVKGGAFPAVDRSGVGSAYVPMLAGTRSPRRLF